MSDHATDGSGDGRQPTDADRGDRPVLAAEIVVFDHRPAKCTVFPADATEIERLTQWMTAEEGSFVGLDEMR